MLLSKFGLTAGPSRIIAAHFVGLALLSRYLYDHFELAAIELHDSDPRLF